jgi:hypothetical protein
MSSVLTPPVPAPASKASTQAVWSLVLGVLGMTCLWLLGSVPAILLGIVAVKNIDRSGGALTGRGLGIAGIVTGNVGIFTGIGTVAIVAALAIPSFSSVRIRAQQTLESSQIQQIVLACRAHPVDEEGRFPASLSELVEGGYLDKPVLEPKSVIGGTYLYRPGLTESPDSAQPILASPVPIEGNRVVGMTDGFVTTVTEEEFQADYAHLFPRG